MIDYWKLTKEFTQGDAVQKIDIQTGDVSPYVGAVTAVHRGIGCLDVQWPFGNERVFPDDVVKVNPAFLRYLPPAFDQSYVTVEIEKARKASAPLWRNFPPSLFIELARHWHKGASEVIAYDDLYRALAPNVDDDGLRDEVSKFYRLARNAGDLRIQNHILKSAAYWVAQNRQYRATGEDIKLGKPACPKCATRMRTATYKMHKGAKHKVFACPKCLYLIDPASILAPTGEPHNWFGTPALPPVMAAKAKDFKKGDKVEVTKGKQKGLKGEVTYVGSGPKGDQVSVAFDHPVQKMMGPAILDPDHLKKVA